MNKKDKKHEESALQKLCVEWFRLQYREYDKLLISVPNGVAPQGKTRDAKRKAEIQGAIRKAEGMVAGVADLLLLLPNKNHPYLCIEMKTEKGRQSDSQKAWQAAVQEKALAKYAVVRSVEQFIETITEYLSNL